MRLLDPDNDLIPIPSPQGGEMRGTVPNYSFDRSSVSIHQVRMIHLDQVFRISIRPAPSLAPPLAECFNPGLHEHPTVLSQFQSETGFRC
jgi:hypothetical protein